MKVEGKLRVILVILAIVLISLVSFGGIFIQKMKSVENIVPDYKFGMDLEGSRLAVLGVDTSTETVIYDKDGKVVSQEGEGTTKKEVPINSEEVLTKENYKKTKKIIEKRLKAMNVSDFLIRQNEETGETYVQLLENENTDVVSQFMAIKGVFTVSNENGDVLLNNSHIKNVQVGYNTTNSGTVVVLSIQLNKEGTQIYKDITNTYVQTTDKEGNTVTKNITAKIDTATILNTYYKQEISNGIMQIQLGNATTDENTIRDYAEEAYNIAVLLNNGSLPITYTMMANRFVGSDLNKADLFIPAITGSVVILIGIVYLVIAYRKNGLLSGISLVGYVAALLLTIRIWNVVLTIEGLVAIAVSVAINYAFILYILNAIKKNESKTRSAVADTFKKAFLSNLFIIIPVAVISVALALTTGWLPASSFGMVAFWGLLLTVLYNLIFTRTLIVDTSK